MAQQAGTPMPDDGMAGHPALDADAALRAEETEEAEDSAEPAADDDRTEPEAQAGAEEGTEEEPSLRFRNQEEAERAHAEAERRMHEATEERALTQRRLDLLEAELLAVRRTQETRPAEPEPALVPAPEPLDVKDLRRKAYRRIEALDPDADDFEERRLDILAETDAQIDTHRAAVHEARMRQIAQEENRQSLERFRTETSQQTDAERKSTKLLDRAAAAGLDVATPTSDNPLGGLHLQELQAAVDQGLYPATADEDTAIQAVIDVVAKRHRITPGPPRKAPDKANGKALEISPETQESTRRVQAQQAPMERAGPGRPTPAPRDEDTRPMTMDEILERTMQPRSVQ